MGLSNQKRGLDRLTRALGEDDHLAEGPKLDTSRVVLVSQVDDLSYAHAAAAVGRAWTTPTPSSGVGTFSGFEFTPDEGLWIRELTCGANSRVYFDYGGGLAVAYTVADNLALTALSCGRPEDTDFPAFLSTTWAALVTGSATVPRIFRNAQIGQAPANPQTGVFIGAGVVMRDIWVPPGATFSILAVAANVGNSVTMQLDLPAENFFT